MDNDEKRKIRTRIRKTIAQKCDDETLQKMIRYCAIEGWVEELRLIVNLPRSSVECCDCDCDYIACIA